ncbi:MAG: hypothetical protein IAE99_07875 [Rhodothermales bacterium]|nr:hypothetical protein [Rhodothermales bacterium]
MRLRALAVWKKRRRLENLHRRLVPSGRLTLDVYEQVVTLLGCHPDRALQDPEEARKLAAVRLDVLGVRKFLDLTHPGHRIDVEGLTVEEAEIVGAAALSNFILLSAQNWAMPGAR